MKNVLLPSDLSVQSLWAVKKIVEDYKGAAPLTIHVIHMLELPSSIGDLLLLGRTKKSRALPYYFKDALQILQSKYNNGEVSIKFDFVYGSTSRLFRNYLEAKQIHEVAVLDGHRYDFSAEDSVDCIPFLAKIKTPVKTISFNPVANSEFQVLSILLNDDKKNDRVGGFNYQSALAG